MTAALTLLLSGLGRRLAFWASLALAIGAAAWVLIRHGRHAAEAELVLRRAETRIRALQTSKDIRDEVQNADRADLERRADRWMRD